MSMDTALQMTFSPQATPAPTAAAPAPRVAITLQVQAPPAAGTAASPSMGPTAQLMIQFAPPSVDWTAEAPAITAEIQAAAGPDVTVTPSAPVPAPTNPTTCTAAADLLRWRPAPYAYPEFAIDRVRYEGRGYELLDGLPTLRCAYNGSTNKWETTPPDALLIILMPDEDLRRYMTPMAYSIVASLGAGYPVPDGPTAAAAHALPLFLTGPVPLSDTTDPEGDRSQDTLGMRLPARLMVDFHGRVPLAERAYQLTPGWGGSGIGIRNADGLRIDAAALQALADAFNLADLAAKDYPIYLQVFRPIGRCEFRAQAAQCQDGTTTNLTHPPAWRFARAPGGLLAQMGADLVIERPVAVLRLNGAPDWLTATARGSDGRYAEFKQRDLAGAFGPDGTGQSFLDFETPSGGYGAYTLTITARTLSGDTPATGTVLSSKTVTIHFPAGHHDAYSASVKVEAPDFEIVIE